MNLTLLLTYFTGMEYKFNLLSFTSIIYYLYELIKRGLDLNKYPRILSRINLYYDRRNQSTNKIHSQEFIILQITKKRFVLKKKNRFF